MWILLMNDMRFGQIEQLMPVARAETREELEALLARERVERYVTVGDRVLHHHSDQMAGVTEINEGYKWGKVFRHGGPLEWFNDPLPAFADEHFIDVGTEEDWAQQARSRYMNQIMPIPMSSSL